MLPYLAQLNIGKYAQSVYFSHQAMLKASLNRRPPAGVQAAVHSGQQGYYFACDNTKGSCGFWRWDDEA